MRVLADTLTVLWWASLPGLHKDPFDRMLIAQALALNLPVVSRDEIFDQYHVARIW